MAIKIKIRITDKWLLTSDSMNFIINEVSKPTKGKNAGKEHIKAVAFYPTLPQAIEGLLIKNMAESTAQDLKTLRNEHTAFIEHVRGLLDGRK